MASRSDHIASPLLSPRVGHRTEAALPYRPDIDGLRAVAVVTVLLYHAYPSAVAGGFVGVDVFFVISGYLISGIIMTDLERGRFSFRAFYGRRVRRIFPALSVVLIATLIYGLLVLFPTELTRLGKHIAAGAGFVSNFAFWSEAGYFDRSANAKPLLHLWSLGVEEQFYIVWPLVLWISWKYSRHLPAVMIGITLVSFCLNLLLASRGDITADFYSPATRIWELSLGALLAALSRGSRGAAVPSPLLHLDRTALGRDLASIAGLLLIVAASLLLDRSMRFPGAWALLPTAGAALLIAAGPSAWSNRTLLSNRLVVSIGLISYPLYLWHWPLLSYATIVRRGRAPKPLLAAILLAAACLLAWLTYRWIERPARFGRDRTRVTIGLIVSMGSIGVLGAVIWAAAGAVFPHRSVPNVDATKIDAAIGDGYFKPTPHMRVREIDRTYVTEIGDGPRAVLFIGDSLVFQYGPRLEHLLARQRLVRSGYFVVGASCAPMPGIIKTGYFAHCRDMPKIAHDLITAHNIDTIVFGAMWSGYNGAAISVERAGVRRPIDTPAALDDVYANLEDEVRDLIADGRVVYLVLTPPASERFDPEHMMTRSPFGFSIDPDVLTGVSVAALRAATADVDRRLIAIAARTGARIIDPLPDICGAGPICSAFFADQEPKFADDKHLRPGFVERNITVFDDLLTR